MSLESVHSIPFSGGPLLKAGAYADLYEALVPDGPAIIKIARGPFDLGGDETREVLFTRGMELVTGGVGSWSPSPNLIVQAEAEMLERITHPAFVRLLDFGRITDAGVEKRYMLLERIEGKTWRQLLESGTWKAYASDAPNPGLDAYRRLVAVLAEMAASEPTFYHGDLKPENLMVEPSGKVRLLDPSRGMTRYDPEGNLTRMMVTDWYNPFLEPSDLPALGILLLELLLGEHPLMASEGRSPDRERDAEFGRKWLERLRMGRVRHHERILDMPLPLDRHGDAVMKLQAIALRCLGLQCRDGVWQAIEPFSNVVELQRELG